MEKEITYEEWLGRLDEFLLICLERRARSFAGIFHKLDRLYAAGCSPGDVGEAIVQELWELGRGGRNAGVRRAG